jgi:hypothetical protein
LKTVIIIYSLAGNNESMPYTQITAHIDTKSIVFVQCSLWGKVSDVAELRVCEYREFGGVVVN